MVKQKMIDVLIAWDHLGKHRRYTVRAAGHGYFMVLDRVTNTSPFINGDHFTSREQAWNALRETEVEAEAA